MKTSFASSTIPFCLFCLLACNAKEKSGSYFASGDSSKLTTDKITATAKNTSEQPGKTPLDTILVSYPDGKNLYFLVLEYYDSLPDKPIKDFAVTDAQSNEPVFRAVSERLALGDEVDPINGRFDSLFVVPTYSISSQNPLTVDLDFVVNGDFRVGYLGDVTYPFYEKKPRNILSFLRYTFQFADNKWIVRSSLKFKPHQCNISQTELMNQFNKVKSDGNLDTERGGVLMKMSFTCFLNNVNPSYEMMNKEFNAAFGESVSPYYYYSYIAYLSKFIVNFTPQ